MENVLVSGVTLDQNQSKVTITGVADRPGLAARIFGPIAEAGIIVDMIIQNASADGRTDMTFTLPRADLRRAVLLMRYQQDLDPTEIARTLDLSLNTVKSHLKRSLATLRLQLSAAEPGGGLLNHEP